jgi:hypothetical protein
MVVRVENSRVDVEASLRASGGRGERDVDFAPRSLLDALVGGSASCNGCEHWRNARDVGCGVFNLVPHELLICVPRRWKVLMVDQVFPTKAATNCHLES